MGLGLASTTWLTYIDSRLDLFWAYKGPHVTCFWLPSGEVYPVFGFQITTYNLFIFQITKCNLFLASQ